MEYVFSFLAGMLTLINPCVLPVLPVVLSAAVQAHRLGPVALAGGMSASFVVLGLGVAAFGDALGIDAESLSRFSAAMMIFFGLVLLIPQASRLFASALSGLSRRADARISRLHGAGLGNQALGGALLGAVWSPCVGPTLGGALALASQQQALFHVAVIMLCFALGVSAVMLALAYGARAALMRRRALMQRVAGRARVIMGVVFVAVGTMLLLRLHHPIEAWLLDVLPIWLQDLSVSI